MGGGRVEAGADSGAERGKCSTRPDLPVKEWFSKLREFVSRRLCRSRPWWALSPQDLHHVLSWLEPQAIRRLAGYPTAALWLVATLSLKASSGPFSPLLFPLLILAGLCTATTLLSNVIRGVWEASWITYLVVCSCVYTSHCSSDLCWRWVKRRARHSKVAVARYDRFTGSPAISGAQRGMPSATAAFGSGRSCWVWVLCRHGGMNESRQRELPPYGGFVVLFEGWRCH